MSTTHFRHLSPPTSQTTSRTTSRNASLNASLPASRTTSRSTTTVTTSSLKWMKTKSATERKIRTSICTTENRTSIDSHYPDPDPPWRTVHPLEHLLLEEFRPNRPEIITVCLTLARRVSRQWVLQVVIPRLLSHPRFRSIVAFAPPSRNSASSFVFEPIPDFSPAHPDYAEHVVMERLPSPKSNQSSQSPPHSPTISSTPLYSQWMSPSPSLRASQISQTIPSSPSSPTQKSTDYSRAFMMRLSDIVSTPLPRTRPLWRLHVFPGYAQASENRSSSSTLVLRAHHALADGIGLLKFFLAQVADPKKGLPPCALLMPHARARGSDAARSRRHGGRPTWPRSAIETIDDVFRVTLTPLARQPSSVFTRSPLQPHTRCAFVPPNVVHLATIRRASRRLDVTINDFLLTAVSGAVRNYLSANGDDPSFLRTLRVVVPFNCHHFESFDSSDLTNKLALLPIVLGVDISDRMHRLRRCADIMRRLKRSKQPSLAIHATRMLARLPIPLRRAAWAHLASSASLLFSNIAGPGDKVSIGGIEVTEMYFLPPAGNHVPVTVGMMSYDGCLHVGVNGDAARLEKPQELADNIAAEIQALVTMSYTCCLPLKRVQ